MEGKVEQKSEKQLMGFRTHYPLHMSPGPVEH